MLRLKIATVAFAVSTATAALMATSAQAGVSKDLPYPTGDLNGKQVADQVYFVNHFYALKNYSIQKKGNTVTVLISQSKGKRPTTLTLTRYLNNDYNDGEVKGKDLAIFHSGKLKGTGLLITDFVDDAKSQSYSIWLPALRKIRRFAQPAHDDAWGGSDFTFGDVTLRKPHHETHELTGKANLEGCLGYIDVAKQYRNKYMKKLPNSGSCDHKGKEVYVLKSTTKFDGWWYDYRVSYVDTTTFFDYRTEFFKDGKKIKVIDRDWVKAKGSDDKRAGSWRSWYGETFATGHQTWAVIPDAIVHTNDSSLKPKLWTERTLRKIKR